MDFAPDLFSKTFYILGIQLFITFITTKFGIRYIHNLYLKGHPDMTATKNEKGELDVHLDFSNIKGYFWAIMILDIIVFVLLLFWGRKDITIGMPLFCIWSVLTGIELALALISKDENLGSRILALTAAITFLAGWIGMYSGIDFSFLGGFLAFALLALILISIVRIFIHIGGMKRRLIAGFGVIIFIGYLLYDFNNLSKAAKIEQANTWPVAMNYAIEIYLDIINLFLQLLDLLGD